ncbi:MAG: glycosyltransferase family 4 protein [Flavobacteriaceae bacterium]
MRIGMILDLPFPPDPRVENEAVSLINSGHEVFLFCLTYDKNEGDSIINGIEVHRYLSNKLEYKLSALAYTFPYYAKLMKSKIHHFLVDNKIDTIHIHDIQIAESVFKANKKLHLPVVLDLHENRPEIMRFYQHLQKFPGKQLISTKKWKKQEEKFIRDADRVVVVTEESKDEIVLRTQKKASEIVVVPNTVRKSFYQNPKINPKIISKFKGRFVLLYIGNTGLRRGLETVIESLKLLNDKIPNILLVIVGKSSDDEYLKGLIAKNNLENHVVFEGWQDQSLFASYIMSSAICVSPLHRNQHHDTTYANKIFQYMSFAIPILVSDATAQKNLVESTNSGLVHQEKSTEDFADKVVQLFEDKSLRTALGENGKQFIVEEFSWEKTSEKLIQLYSELKT